MLFLDRLLGHFIQQEIGDIVGQGTADQKLHRKIVNTFGVRLIVRLLRAHPALGKNIAHGTGQGLKLFPWAGGFQVDDIIKQEMPFVESIVGS